MHPNLCDRNEWPVCSVALSLLLTDAQLKHFHLTASQQEQAGGTQDPQIATLESSSWYAA